MGRCQTTKQLNIIFKNAILSDKYMNLPIYMINTFLPAILSCLVCRKCSFLLKYFVILLVDDVHLVHFVQTLTQMTHQTPPFMGMHIEPDEGNLAWLTLLTTVWYLLSLIGRKPGYGELASLHTPHRCRCVGGEWELKGEARWADKSSLWLKTQLKWII